MPNGECLFCQIADGKIPAEKLYEDSQVIVIMDINPVNPGHALVIPKKHSVDMLDQDDEILQQMIVVSKKIAKAILNALGYEAFNLTLNSGRIAGQIQPHLHWHIIPRKAGDGLEHWPGKKYEGKEAEILADQIRAVLE